MKLLEDRTRPEKVVISVAIAILGGMALAALAFLVFAGLLYMLIPAGD
jgi:hypothetical protein